MAIEELLLDAGLSIEDDVEELDYYLVVQRVINTGLWSLQGSYGRTMMDAIKAGRCLLGPAAVRDYYGNTVPSRTDVQPGTKGSYDFVVDTMGVEWAEQMASV